MVEDGDATNSAISTSNVGHRLLQMMGWAGGGLGKSGAGIAEPITAQAVFDRQVIVRVTRLVENSPSRRLFTSGSVFENYQSSPTLGDTFPQLKVCINFSKTLCGQQFRRFFHKLIWSHRRSSHLLMYYYLVKIGTRGQRCDHNF
jgi:hypothetical protein